MEKLSRRHEEVLKRKAAAATLRQKGHTLREIAEFLGYKNHSAVQKILVSHEDEMSGSEAYRAIYTNVPNLFQTCSKR